MFKRTGHESTRRAYEELRQGPSIRTARGGVLPQGVQFIPGLRARGTIAFPLIYTLRDGIAPKKTREYFVERLAGKGIWVTADRDMQGRNLTEARRLCKLARAYRVVVKNAYGAYVPDTDTPKYKQ